MWINSYSNSHQRHKLFAEWHHCIVSTLWLWVFSLTSYLFHCKLKLQRAKWYLRTLRKTRLLSFFVLVTYYHNNSSDIPEVRIRKSTAFFLTLWFIPERRGGFKRNVAVQPWLPLLYYSLCRVGRGSRDNLQTGAEVRNVQGNL